MGNIVNKENNWVKCLHYAWAKLKCLLGQATESFYSTEDVYTGQHLNRDKSPVHYMACEQTLIRTALVFGS